MVQMNLRKNAKHPIQCELLDHKLYTTKVFYFYNL